MPPCHKVVFTLGLRNPPPGDESKIFVKETIYLPVLWVLCRGGHSTPQKSQNPPLPHAAPSGREGLSGWVHLGEGFHKGLRTYVGLPSSMLPSRMLVVFCIEQEEVKLSSEKKYIRESIWLISYSSSICPSTTLSFVSDLASGG